jgi:hypothetical protein
VSEAGVPPDQTERRPWRLLAPPAGSWGRVRATAGATGTRFTIWDLAIFVLGANIWISFLLLPVLHLERPGAGPFVTAFLVVAPLVLVFGLLLRQRLILLALYPGLLVVPSLHTPQLVGVNVYTTWTFCLVGLSFLAYYVGTPLMLGIIESPPVPDEGKDLEAFPLTPKWSRRLRIYRWLALLAGIFPAVLVFALYLHPQVGDEMVRYFPGRHAEAHAFFGVLMLGLWIGIFSAYLLSPLKAHTRGDPQLRYELQQLRKASFVRRPRLGFYISVAVALLLMGALILYHW